MSDALLVDSHCHLPLLADETGSLDVILENAKRAGIGHLLCVSIDLDSYPIIRELARKYNNISTSVGVHPNTKVKCEPSVEELVKQANEDPNVVAIGETGLDYYRSTGDLDWQQQRFITHINAAIETAKPLIIHTRDAGEDTVALMKSHHADQVSGVMHCFVDDYTIARKALDLGFYISFSGIVTFKNAQQVQEVASRIPLDRLLVETDSPYLAPMPFRGKTNQPAYVRHVAEYVAQLRKIELDDLINATTNNFFNLFKQARQTIEQA